VQVCARNGRIGRILPECAGVVNFAVSNRFNLIHGSDSAEAAAREIGMSFKPEELFEYADAQECWIYDLSTGERV